MLGVGGGVGAPTSTHGSEEVRRVETANPIYSSPVWPGGSGVGTGVGGCGVGGGVGASRHDDVNGEAMCVWVLLRKRSKYWLRRAGAVLAPAWAVLVLARALALVYWAALAWWWTLALAPRSNNIAATNHDKTDNSILYTNFCFFFFRHLNFQSIKQI